MEAAPSEKEREELFTKRAKADAGDLFWSIALSFVGTLFSLAALKFSADGDWGYVALTLVFGLLLASVGISALVGSVSEAKNWRLSNASQ